MVVVEYKKFQYDYKGKSIVPPEIKINNQKVEITSEVHTKDLKNHFIQWCTSLLYITIVALLIMIVIMLNAGKYMIYVGAINVIIAVAVGAKNLCDYHKYKITKNELSLYEK